MKALFTLLIPLQELLGRQTRGDVLANDTQSVNFGVAGEVLRNLIVGRIVDFRKTGTVLMINAGERVIRHRSATPRDFDTIPNGWATSP